MRTTIYIDIDLVNRLKSASAYLHVSPNECIKIIIHKAMSYNSFPANAFKVITYQLTDPDKTWYRFHVELDYDTYEMCLDIRKFYKVSVSFFISYAIINFLDDIIKKQTSSMSNRQSLDNYPSNYIFIVKTYNKIKIFIVIWGIPENNKLLELLE